MASWTKRGSDRSRRGRLWSAVLTAGLLLTACGAGTGALNASPPTSSASPLPFASIPVGRLPIGRIVAANLAGFEEGAFVGAFVMGVDGVAQPLTLADPVLGYSGAWSPGGDRLLVNVFDGERLVATVLDPASGTSTELKPEGMAGELECSDWAPDARHVICTRGGPDPATDGIYTVDVASGTTKRVTTSPYHHVLGTEGDCGGGEGRAVYSSDGGRFAWVQQRCGTGADPAAEEKGAIAVGSADGSNVKVIVPFGGTRTHPGGEISWSPTDDLIAFGTPEGVLSVIKADGTGLRTITLPVAGMVYGPAWSPDGKWLLVTIAGDPSFRHDLFAVAADGGSLVRLTDNREAEAFTDWAIAP